MEKGKLFSITLLGTLVVLTAVIYSISAGGTDSGREQWKLPLNATPYMYVGDENRLYLFDNNDIYAINPDGSQAWKMKISSNWSVINKWDIASTYVQDDTGLRGHCSSGSGPVFAADNNTLYLYLRSNPDASGNQVVPDLLTATRDGSIVWEHKLPVKSDAWVWDTSCPNIEVYDDRVYLFYRYNVTVFDTAGSELFTIPNVSDPPAVDETGRIYVVEACWPDWLEDHSMIYASPSGTIKAYSPEGSLLWDRSINETAVRRELQGCSIAGETSLSQSIILALPIYANHTLLVPLADGIIALYTNGSIRWTDHLGLNVTLIGGVPYDTAGNVYMTESVYDWEFFSDHDLGSLKYVYVIAPDGSWSITDPHHLYPYDDRVLVQASNGTGYYGFGRILEASKSRPLGIIPMNLTAVDIKTGNDLWTFDVPISRTNSVTVTRENVDSLFDGQKPEASRFYNNLHPDLNDDKKRQYGYYSESDITILPADSIVYISYYGYNFDYPVMNEKDATYDGDGYIPAFNRTKFTYASGICALDRNGTFLWQKPTGSFVVGMAANNSTLYYGTQTGGIAAVALAAGVTVVAAALLFLHFFGAATVSRARSRLEQNENRLAILQLVKERPGSTMYEISRELNMNLGTMRYHLLILGINHKIREHKDGKYVRFFPGSQVFTDIELEVMSLLRREPIRRLMGVLCEKPGISNSEIACALGISESAVSNYMRELSTKGLVTKEVTAAGRVAYMIRKEHAEKIENVLTSTG